MSSLLKQAANELEEDTEGARRGMADNHIPPYSIHAATSSGYNSSGQLVLEEGQLFFAIDWSSDASAQYNPDCIEQPQMHESVRQAKRRREEGPKPYDLGECIDVGFQHDFRKPTTKIPALSQGLTTLILVAMISRGRKPYAGNGSLEVSSLV
jgi:hypothetical protein